MINSTNLHDDLDVVTSVHMPETSYTIQQPIFDQQLFNPIEYRVEKSTVFENLHVGKHNLVRRFKLKPIDRTLISYPFSISIKLPELICINIIISKHNNDNSKAISLKNISLQKIVQLIHYNQQFSQEPISRISNNLLLNKKLL